MKFYVVLLISVFGLSCDNNQTSDISDFISHSREQLTEMGYTAGWTARDSGIVEEYDKLAALSGTPDLLNHLMNSDLLKDAQKSALKQLINLHPDPNIIRVALLNSFTANINDYRFILDVCSVKFSSEGIVRVNFESSALRKSVWYATNREDYDNGNLIEKDFPEGSASYKLPGLSQGDSVFGYFSFPYFSGENPKFEFKGIYEEKSR